MPTLADLLRAEIEMPSISQGYTMAAQELYKKGLRKAIEIIEAKNIITAVFPTDEDALRLLRRLSEDDTWTMKVSEDFYYAHTPIITGNAVQFAGERYPEEPE
jgi:hypothetical protein